jgi:hypothetical protein
MTITRSISLKMKINPTPARFFLPFFFFLLLNGCATQTPPQLVSAPVNINAVRTEIAATAQAELKPVTPTAAPTQTAPASTPSASATPQRTPPALPGIFATTLLNPLDQPQTYIAESCEYLRAKWTAGNAAPGSVVMVIMFHSIPEERKRDPNEILQVDFRFLMNKLKEAGFETIDTQQLADFLYQNASIPPRSVLLIVDDRRYRKYFDEFFGQYHEEWGWKVVNSWINHDDAIGRLALPGNLELHNAGWVDYQSHGFVHNIPMSDNSSDEYLKGELQGSMQAMQANFGKTPIAIIWPGGGFGARPVQAAREYGYQLGFTINPRGPVMFNWIPQASLGDPMRPSYIPEGAIGDPLMTLPRYWAPDAVRHLPTILEISEAAQAYALENRATELEYYNIACAPTYGELP